MRADGPTGTPSATRALLAPAPAPVDDAVRARLRERLTGEMATAAGHLAPTDQVLITVPLLRQARQRPHRLAEPDGAFAWKPAFVRRSLGLSIVHACVTGRFATPLEAAGPVSSDAVADWTRTGWRTFHWEPWMAGLPAGARAAVLADAVGWASSLWTAFDWRAIPRLPEFGGAYDQWGCPTAHPVRLKARSELRVELDGPDDPAGPTAGSPVPDRPTVLVSVSGGCPGPGWSEELAFVALVAGVRSPSRPVPARVLGLWPDAGAHAAVDIDADTLMAAVDRVVVTLEAVAAARASRGVSR